MTLPASFRGKNTTRPDYEHQNSNLYAISGQSRSLWKLLMSAFADHWYLTKVALPVVFSNGWRSLRDLWEVCLHLIGCKAFSHVHILLFWVILWQTDDIKYSYPQLQQVDLMGITIKSLAEIEKEVSTFTIFPTMQCCLGHFQAFLFFSEWHFSD